MRRTIGLILGLALGTAACGDQTTETTSATATTPAQTTSTTAPPGTSQAGSVTFVGADGVESAITDTSRIVSLNGDLTEIIFELGLGDHVMAVDVTTTYPPEAAGLPRVGFGQLLAAEPVLAFQPTLVIGDTQIQPPEAVQQLRDAGVPVVILETQTTLEGVETKITQIAEMLGVAEAGRQLADRVNTEIEAARELAATAAEQPEVAFVYVRGPQLVLLFGQGMPTSSMIEAANAVDVGAASGVRGAVPMTPEALVAANPSVIVVPESGLAALGGTDAFLKIPGVAETAAGRAKAILAYEEGYFLGFGPRVGSALAEFAKDLHPELAGY